MPSTPTYALRYPALSDDPNVPEDMKNLADDVEDALEQVDAKIAASATRSDREDVVGSITSTTYTGTMASGSAPPGIDFVAPPSGKVTILFGTAGFNAANNDNKTAVRVGTGSTVGAGTEFYAATDSDMILYNARSTEAYRLTSFAEVTGLTPGNTYNVQMQHKVSAGTGSFLFRFVKVIPDL